MDTKVRTAKPVFLSLIEGFPPDQWPKLLDEYCGSNLPLRCEVERLLSGHTEELDLVKQGEAALREIIRVEDQPSIISLAGTQIGPYHLLEQIGEGGMGVVFMAEQVRPVRRRVALKVIKPGMDTREVIGRFEAERQALAMMEHPNIAKVHDAGATENGRPYFVMELVQGVPITEYCDQCNLTTRERLELFITVCQTVQHAHQKGVIHRDLKPTNILVAIQDGRPAPKIIDFGIAKAIFERLTERTLVTSFAQMIGTPTYMSPEQAELSPLGADTRSDIYSLGVLLYELLTGTTPFDKDRFHAASYDALRRILRDEEPPRPSARLSTLAADLATTIADNRRTDLRWLRQTIRGELDWIVMKCLEKNRNRRYETASDLVRDVERYLNDEPVQASPPSRTYRVKKFVRRNSAAVMSAAAILLVAILGLAATTFLVAQERDAARDAAERERLAASQADRERQRAEANLRTAREAVDKLFTNLGQELEHKPHMEQIRRRLFEDALEFYQGFLKQKSSDPQMRRETALAYQRVGGIQETLGNGPQAEVALRQAVVIFEKLTTEFPAVPEYREDLDGSRRQLATRLMWANKHDEWVELRRLILSDCKQLVADFPTVPGYYNALAFAHTSLGIALKDVGKLPEAEQHYRQALVVREKLRADFPNTPEDRGGLAHSHLWLGVFLLHTDRLQEAEVELREAIALSEQLVADAPDHPGLKSNLAHVQSYVADLLRKTDKPHEAVQYYRKAIEIREKLRDDFPDDKEQQRRLAHEYAGLSRSLLALGRTQEAEQALRRSVSVSQKLVDDRPGVEPYPHDLGWRYYDLGLLLHDSHRPDEAAEAFRQARELFEKGAEEFPDVADRHYTLAWMLATCPALQFRDPERAVETVQRALQHAPLMEKYWRVLGIAQYGAGNWQASIEALNKAMELDPKNESSEEMFFLAMAHWQLGHKDKARALYEKAVESTDEDPSDDVLRFRIEAAELLGITEPQSAESQPSEDVNQETDNSTAVLQRTTDN